MYDSTTLKPDQFPPPTVYVYIYSLLSVSLLTDIISHTIVNMTVSPEPMCDQPFDLDMTLRVHCYDPSCSSLSTDHVSFHLDVRPQISFW